MLVGWTFEIDFLKRIVPGYVFMNPTAATAFVLASIALWFFNGSNNNLRRLARLLAAIVAFAGLAKLCAIVGLHDIGIDRIFFSGQLLDKVTGQANQMAPQTALNFLLLGTALLLLDVRTKRGRDLYLLQYSAIIVILFSFLAVIGYVYGAKSLYVSVSFNPMALHTAVSFLLLAVGLLLSSPERGIIKELFSADAGGEIARRLFPINIKTTLNEKISN